ncbi:Insulin-like domain and Insulin family-containing protein [Strongyloides ratti]|uniref:Insulin-like domain and Insulin family-containing protein n=1 Tax=Strongyloides ratti TaxID=34506 RepID=A0A090KP95_STRRB|nr:Insulin-like domain and Insulin family-containing protein [Strongyloides ratti]CEF59423.1 Insulin-like domain and Insulin family-containing protein [Strongyloides ratti]
MKNNNNLNTISNKNLLWKGFLFIFVIFILFQRSEGSVRLCGYRLSKMLITVCRSHSCSKDTELINQETIEKKSIENDKFFYPENDFQSEIFNLNPFKRSGGVVNDCCINRCTISHLKTYCCGYADEEIDF